MNYYNYYYSLSPLTNQRNFLVKADNEADAKVKAMQFLSSKYSPKYTVKFISIEITHPFYI